MANTLSLNETALIEITPDGELKLDINFMDLGRLRQACSWVIGQIDSGELLRHQDIHTFED